MLSLLLLLWWPTASHSTHVYFVLLLFAFYLLAVIYLHCKVEVLVLHLLPVSTLGYGCLGLRICCGSLRLGLSLRLLRLFFFFLFGLFELKVLTHFESLIARVVLVHFFKFKFKL